MNLKEIRDLISLMNEHNLCELEIEREGTKIRLKKSSSGKFETITEETGVVRIDRDRSTHETDIKKEDINKKNLIAIKAPMVGTFYRSPGTDAKPYIEMGQDVEIGKPVCIIEAMKLMNEIKSEVKGKIVEVLVENATAVEYGQALFMVEKTED